MSPSMELGPNNTATVEPRPLPPRWTHISKAKGVQGEIITFDSDHWTRVHEMYHARGFEENAKDLHAALVRVLPPETLGHLRQLMAGEEAA